MRHLGLSNCLVSNSVVVHQLGLYGLLSYIVCEAEEVGEFVFKRNTANTDIKLRD